MPQAQAQPQHPPPQNRSQPFPLLFDPGIQRDGTDFDGNRSLDARWCRWRMQKPRKMLGYKRVTDRLLGPARRVHVFYLNSQAYIHVASLGGIQQIILDQNGTLVSVNPRTPPNWAAGGLSTFTMDAIFDTTSNVVQLVVHCSVDGGNVGSSLKTTPFIGQIDSASALTEFSNPNPASGLYTKPSVSGGVFCVQPYVFDFDSNGFVGWSSPNLPNYLGVTQGNLGAGQARISAQKIVAGMPTRGGGAQSPAALFWSLSELISATFTGGAPVWSFNPISSSSSILSGASVIEYDSLYFWVGNGRILVYNGTVTEVPNSQNQDWFFNNLTPGYQSRIFAFKVPAYGEIWWCAPMFGNTEPSHALILNVRENVFYDTELPAGGRAGGFFAQAYSWPVMTGATKETDAPGYDLWLHEYGLDEVKTVAGRQVVTPIESYFVTPWIGAPKNNPPNDQGLSTEQIEPDLEVVGDMEVTVYTTSNARGKIVPHGPFPIKAIPSIPQEQLVGTKVNGRLTKFKFSSNVAGGNYTNGRTLVHAVANIARITD